MGWCCRRRRCCWTKQKEKILEKNEEIFHIPELFTRIPCLPWINIKQTNSVVQLLLLLLLGCDTRKTNTFQVSTVALPASRCRWRWLHWWQWWQWWWWWLTLLSFKSMNMFFVSTLTHTHTHEIAETLKLTHVFNTTHTCVQLADSQFALYTLFHFLSSSLVGCRRERGFGSFRSGRIIPNVCLL